MARHLGAKVLFAIAVLALYGCPIPDAKEAPPEASSSVSGSSSGLGGSGEGGSGGIGGSGGVSSSSSSNGSASSTSSGTGSSSSGSGGSGGSGGGGPTSTFTSRSFLCKLINNASLQDPTPNQLHTRFNLMGTELGVPVVSGNFLYLFFGDTQGYKVIWGFGEDPDSVARIPFANVVADPTTLCKSLEFYVTPDNPSVANATDSTILRDFAGVYMLPPMGQNIANYITQAAGPFPNIPGTFEAPTGGFSKAGKVFLFYAGLVQTAPNLHATLGYLASWDPATNVPTFQILRSIDALSNGALGGHFIQTAPVDDGVYTYLFGTGAYRHSGVYLARLGSAALETGGGEELFDPSTKTWKLASSMTATQRQNVPPLFEDDGVGEISVRRIDNAGLYVALYQRQYYDAMGNKSNVRVLFRFATTAEGPWSDPLTIIDGNDPDFQSTHCCGTTCPGSQILHCNLASLYGAYMLPSATATPAAGGAFDVKVPFVVSTWDPYNVVAFTTSVKVVP